MWVSVRPSSVLWLLVSWVVSRISEVLVEITIMVPGFLHPSDIMAGVTCGVIGVDMVGTEVNAEVVAPDPGVVHRHILVGMGHVEVELEWLLTEPQAVFVPLDCWATRCWQRVGRMRGRCRLVMVIVVTHTEWILDCYFLVDFMFHMVISRSYFDSFKVEMSPNIAFATNDTVAANISGNKVA